MRSLNLLNFLQLEAEVLFNILQSSLDLWQTFDFTAHLLLSE